MRGLALSLCCAALALSMNAVCAQVSGLDKSRSLGSGSLPEGLVFRPADFGCGQEVEARLPLGTSAAWPELTLRPGSGLPLSDDKADPELRELKLTRGKEGWELRLRFIAWSPGPGLLPARAIQGLSLPAIPYTAIARLGPQDREPELPRPQAMPPGASLYLYGLAGLFLALVFASLGAALWLLPAARALLEKRRAAQAFRGLDRSLDYLASQARSSEPSAFYAALARALRLYLAERVQPEAAVYSAAEFLSLPDSSFPAEGLREETAALIAQSDRARYAGEKPPSVVLSESVERARNIGRRTEEAIDAGI